MFELRMIDIMYCTGTLYRIYFDGDDARGEHVTDSYIIGKLISCDHVSKWRDVTTTVEINKQLN